MTYFPQPNPASPARRVKVDGSIAAAIRSEGTEPVPAKLHDLSATGGLLLMSRPLEPGDFVEVALQTTKGTVRGMAEVLVAKRASTSGCLQPFRFVAMDDENYSRLRVALESLSNQTMAGPASKRRRSL